MPPVKHLCSQWDRLWKLENLLDPEQGIVMDKLHNLELWQERIENKMDKFIEAVDARYVKKESFQLAIVVIGIVGTILWLIWYIMAFTK